MPPPLLATTTPGAAESPPGASLVTPSGDLYTYTLWGTKPGTGRLVFNILHQIKLTKLIEVSCVRVSDEGTRYSAPLVALPTTSTAVLFCTILALLSCTVLALLSYTVLALLSCLVQYWHYFLVTVLALLSNLIQSQALLSSGLQCQGLVSSGLQCQALPSWSSVTIVPSLV